MRLVLDTNVLVSSLITRGRTAELLQQLLTKKAELVLSKPILDEFVDVTARPKFRQYVGKGQVEDFLKVLLGAGLLVDLRSKFDVTPDRIDNEVLATAYDAKADYIVSGDKYLQRLKQFKGVKIVSVNEMLRILERAR